MASDLVSKNSTSQLEVTHIGELYDENVYGCQHLPIHHLLDLSALVKDL